MLANLQLKYAVWKNPQMRLVGIRSHLCKKNMAKIDAEYELPEIGAKLTIAYKLNNKGALQVTQKLVAGEKKDVPNMFRFGMRMEMPAEYDRVEYYGRGPIENYVDRNHSTFVGIYEQTTDEQFYSYIRPQENGSHYGCEYAQITDDAALELKRIDGAARVTNGRLRMRFRLSPGEKK